MAWRGAFRSFLGSGATISMLGGGVTTGTYVIYKDTSRDPRMMNAFARGNILPPLAENDFEVAYFHRTSLETTLRKLLRPTFQNEYFVVSGPVGTGKTRVMVELVRELIKEDGGQQEGAPLYVLVNQGKSFPDTLAKAVHFNFDEHISFKFFLDYVLRIHSFPSKDEDNRLVRVLDAIERSAFAYMQLTGRPVILVIDGVDTLVQTMPGALERLQDKAKLWADANAVKIIFVLNNDETSAILQSNQSNWSRAASILHVDDLSKEESISFLTSEVFMESGTTIRNAELAGRLKSKSTANTSQKAIYKPEIDRITPELGERIYNLIGGRIHDLITFKRSLLSNGDFDAAADSLKDREREKFHHVSSRSSLWRTVSSLRSAPDNRLLASKLIKGTSPEDVDTLLRRNIVRYERDKSGLIIRFHSALTESVVREMEEAYQDQKSSVNLK